MVNTVPLWRVMVLGLILTVFSPLAIAQPDHSSLLTDIQGDYQSYYSLSRLGVPLMGFALGGLSANTDLDPIIRTEWQTRLRSHNLDNLSDVIDSYSLATHWIYALPVYGLTQALNNTHPINTWGNTCLRILVIGAPQQWALTNFLGGSRPEQQQPQWHLFRYDRAVSGHAFYGAVPILALAAQQQNESLRALLYGLSVIPGLARINNDKHYFSQAFLGWWIALQASNTIVHRKVQNLSFEPHIDGFMLHYSFKLNP